MLGTFQQSHLRIEVNAAAIDIQQSLLCPAQLRQWLWPQQLPTGLPDRLSSGLTFTMGFGPITVQQHVEIASANCLRLLLSRGIDGFHEWYWGDGWIQSRLEGVSLLPLNLGNTLSLWQLRQMLTDRASSP
jgi:hypothetical protein